eukprot:CAMPEP_0172297674 /NCGR_PEP_ID=MMETSP1058-20130122/605_1 /TAXON_ID=83371 /ORGANISM="Detonula confervacea, Strain CCMP 353" /LENGTH=92 /DNA_ID=CAMNT_0013006849 /DNA_START=175 /DNA_END=453 /DNA_ORIENTATION=-
MAQKTITTTFFGLFCYQAYQLGAQMRIGTDEAKKAEWEHPQAGFIQMLRDKYDEEYEKYFDTGHRDWYDKDDDSWKEKLPKPQDYQPNGKRN